MRVSALFHGGLVNEKPRVSALARKSVRTIDPQISNMLQIASFKPHNGEVVRRQITSNSHR